MGLSYSKISNFWVDFAAFRISPSEETNSVYIISTPCCLHTKRNGGSLTSSIGAKSKGNSPKSLEFPIFTDITAQKYAFFILYKQTRYTHLIYMLLKLIDLQRWYYLYIDIL